MSFNMIRKNKKRIKAKNCFNEKPDLANDYYLRLSSIYSRGNINLQNGSVLFEDDILSIIKFFKSQKYR